MSEILFATVMIATVMISKIVLSKMLTLRSLFVQTVVVASLVACTLSQTGKFQQSDKSFLEQEGCPIKAIASGGSSLVVKNVSDKPVASFVLVCLVAKGKKYNVVDTYNSSPEILIDPGGFSHEGGMDATPLNACQSHRGLLAVGFVKFTDASAWVSPFMKRVRVP